MADGFRVVFSIPSYTLDTVSIVIIILHLKIMKNYLFIIIFSGYNFILHLTVTNRRPINEY